MCYLQAYTRNYGYEKRILLTTMENSGGAMTSNRVIALLREDRLYLPADQVYWNAQSASGKFLNSSHRGLNEIFKWNDLS